MATDYGIHVPGYEVLEELNSAATICMLKVQGPDKKFKLWKCYDLRNGGQAVEMKHLGLLRKLHHSYLNAVTNFFHVEDQQVLVVESDLPTMTLRDRLEECKTTAGTGLPAEELIQYMEQAAEVIDFLTTPQHEFQGKKIALYHRSLRPESLHIFDDRAKRVCKVADFGLAKPVTEIDESVRHSLGLTNYEYSPPEYDEGQTTATSDQYSLAVCYYELRTGELPFQGSMLQRLQAQLAGTPTLDLVPAEEQEILKKALARDPKQRFGNCKEFVKELKTVLPKSATATSPASLHKGSGMFSALTPMEENMRMTTEPKVSPFGQAAGTGSGLRPSLYKPDVSPMTSNPRVSLPRTSTAQLNLANNPSGEDNPAVAAYQSLAPMPDEISFTEDLSEEEPEVIQHSGVGNRTASLREAMNINGRSSGWFTWALVILISLLGIGAFCYFIYLSNLSKQ